MASRSPQHYMRRKRMRSLGWPGPDFSPGHMLVNQYPDPSGKSLTALIAGEGNPPADRVIVNDWSPPTENGDGQ